DYVRKQTLANGERFVTNELKEMEARILSAESRAEELERELFLDLLRQVGERAARLLSAARAVARLDVLAAWADLAAERGYVRPRRARLPLTDRIFTRIGAQDDLAAGASTFLVEMAETANILRHATPCSLVILDEVGRGTSTYDGLAIARAVLEDLHDRVGALTLFATHYHELTALANALPGVRNIHATATEEGDRLVFL